MSVAVSSRIDSRRAAAIAVRPLAIGALVIAHFLFLAIFFAPAISTPDANGYLAQARLIARELTTEIVAESPAQYVGDHWMRVREGHYFGQYPPGLPALLAVVFRLLGPYAALWVIPVMGSLALLGLYLVVREWVGARWALLAAAIMAVNPYSNAHALGADSHTAVCFFLIWALYALVRWDHSRGAGWGALAGLCLGIIPTIRYPETLFLIPFALYVLTSVPRDARFWRSLVAATVAASVPLVSLAIRNQIAFGAFWKTGYSISGEQTGFGLRYFVLHAVPYLFLLLTHGLLLAFPAGILGMAELCNRPDTARRGRLLVGLVLPITLLYMAYYWHADSKSTRFLLPTLAMYTIAAVWLLKIWSESAPAWSRKWTKILMGTTLAWGLPISIFMLSHLKGDNRQLAEVTAAIERHVEPGSVLISQRGLLQHLDFIGQWRLAAEEALDHPARPSRPIGPDSESGPPRFEELRDSISPRERTRAFRDEIGRWAGESPGRPVYWLTSRDRRDEVISRLSEESPFTEVAEIEVKGGPRPQGPPPMRPDDDADVGEDPRARRPPAGRGFWRWLEPPPGGPGGPRGPGRGGPPGGPPRFDAPADGKLILLRWSIKR